MTIQRNMMRPLAAAALMVACPPGASLAADGDSPATLAAECRFSASQMLSARSYLRTLSTTIDKREMPELGDLGWQWVVTTTYHLDPAPAKPFGATLSEFSIDEMKGSRNDGRISVSLMARVASRDYAGMKSAIFARFGAKGCQEEQTKDNDRRKCLMKLRLNDQIQELTLSQYYGDGKMG